MLAQPLRKDAARRLLSQIIGTGVVRFTKHALRELKADGITQARALVVLQGGVLSEAEWENGQWRHHIEAQQDVLVLTFEDELNAVVITGWRRKR